MSVSQIARRYAHALADVAEARGDQARTLEELQEIRRLFKEVAELREVFNNPAVDRTRKENLLQAILGKTGLSPITANFLRLLLRNHRLGQLPEITDQYVAELDRRQGITPVEVHAARPLTAEEKQRLQSRFEGLTGRSVRMTFSSDDHLIGGVSVRCGSEVYDGSIRTQLQTLRRQLSR